MNRRAFSTEAAATSDRDRSRKKFRDHHPGWHKSKISPESDFHLRNAAPSGITAHEGKNQTGNN
jgi:hypothetical protein